jgi:transposase-like protein
MNELNREAIEKLRSDARFQKCLVEVLADHLASQRYPQSDDELGDVADVVHEGRASKLDPALQKASADSQKFYSEIIKFKSIQEVRDFYQDRIKWPDDKEMRLIEGAALEIYMEDNSGDVIQ